MLPLLFSCATSLVCGPGTVEVDGVCRAVVQDEADGDTDTDTDSDTDSDTDADTDTDTDSDTDVDEEIEVYLLAGQSNMDGYGMVTGLPPSQRVAQQDVPLYWSGWGTFSSLAPASAGGSAYTGPEVSFGRSMADAGHRVALVKHAVGGTDLAEFWHPGADPEDTNVGTGWAVLMDSVVAAEAELDAAGEPWRWAGFVWMQGESDANEASWAAAYDDNLTHLLSRVREELDTPELPVVIGLIACEGLCAGLETVREAQQAVADADDDVVTVETLDLPRNPYDTWHYDGPSTRVMGDRFAAALRGDEAASAPEPALRITSYSADYDGEYTVGWRFTTDQDVVITDVGGFGEDVLWLSQEYAIWEADSGEMLERGTIPGWYETPTSYRDGFWYTAIEPLELPEGDYIIGLVSWSGDGNMYIHGAGGTEGNGVTYVESRYASGNWLQLPTIVGGGSGFSFLGPNFLYRLPGEEL